MLWTAGLSFIGLIGFLAHVSLYVILLGPYAYGPDVPIGWPGRFLFLTCMIWVVTLGSQAIRVASRDAVYEQLQPVAENL